MQAKYLLGLDAGNTVIKAGFYGLADWHGEGHILRALLEGVVFEHRRHFEVLTGAGITIDRAVLSGGGSRSPHWPQMMADALGVPVAVAECEQAGALGAAILAGIGAGIFADHEAGVSAMPRARHTHEPDAAMRAHYGERYRTWLALIEAMRPFWAAQNRSAAPGVD